MEGGGGGGGIEVVMWEMGSGEHGWKNDSLDEISWRK